MKIYAKDLADKQRYSVGDRITIDLGDLGVHTAIAVKEELGGRAMMFFFDREIAECSAQDMDFRLGEIWDSFPEDMQMRVYEVRSLQASEVFSDCDDPQMWRDFVSSGVPMENPQIPYLHDSKNREPSGIRWYWLSTTLPYVQDDAGNPVCGLVTTGGDSGYDSIYAHNYLRPVFIMCQ